MNRLSISLLVICAVAYGANLRKLAPRLNGRIVGGEDTKIEDFPYQLSLQFYSFPVCGAAIISEYWALTTGECVFDSTPKEISLRAGSNTEGKGGSLHKAVEIYIHPKNNPGISDYEYALIKVGKPFPIGNAGVQAISLADSEPNAGDIATITGWGAVVTGGEPSKTLQKVDVPIVDRKQCERDYHQFNVTDRMICAGYPEGGKDSCLGDAGGPLVSNGKLVGLVSWGLGCGIPGYPGVYANVADQRDWIKEVSGA